MKLLVKISLVILILIKLIGAIAHHSSIVYGDKMYLFGGSQNTPSPSYFYTLDLRSYKWEVVNSRGEVPERRDDHTAIFYDNSMVIFGGFIEGAERTNSLYRYYFKDNKWEKIQVLCSDRPSPRAGHSAVMNSDSMVVFGGRDEEAKSNELWLFSLSSYKWEYVDTEDKPVGRSGHSAQIYRDLMIVFGGIFEVTKELDDMYIFDMKNRRWILFFEEVSSPMKALSSVEGDSPKSKKSRKFESYKVDRAPQSVNTSLWGGIQQMHSPNGKMSVN